MTVDAALEHADLCCGWEGAAQIINVLTGEVRRLREADQAYIDTIEDLHDEIGRLRAVLTELDESSEYWSEYDVPLGIVDRIKAVLEQTK